MSSAKLLQENRDRVKIISNSSNSCFLISLFNAIRSSDVFFDAVKNELKAVSDAAGLLEELRALVEWNNTRPAKPDALRMYISGGSEGVDFANLEEQDPADCYSSLLQSLAKEMTPEMTQSFSTRPCR
jgi:hypothetical protein